MDGTSGRDSGSGSDNGETGGRLWRRKNLLGESRDENNRSGSGNSVNVIEIPIPGPSVRSGGESRGFLDELINFEEFKNAAAAKPKRKRGPRPPPPPPPVISGSAGEAHIKNLNKEPKTFPAKKSSPKKAATPKKGKSNPGALPQVPPPHVSTPPLTKRSLGVSDPVRNKVEGKRPKIVAAALPNLSSESNGNLADTQSRGSESLLETYQCEVSKFFKLRNPKNVSVPAPVSRIDFGSVSVGFQSALKKISQQYDSDTASVSSCSTNQEFNRMIKQEDPANDAVFRESNGVSGGDDHDVIDLCSSPEPDDSPIVIDIGDPSNQIRAEPTNSIGIIAIPSPSSSSKVTNKPLSMQDASGKPSAFIAPVEVVPENATTTAPTASNVIAENSVELVAADATSSTAAMTTEKLVTVAHVSTSTNDLNPVPTRLLFVEDASTSTDNVNSVADASTSTGDETSMVCQVPSVAHASTSTDDLPPENLVIEDDLPRPITYRDIAANNVESPTERIEIVNQTRSTPGALLDDDAGFPSLAITSVMGNYDLSSGFVSDFDEDIKRKEDPLELLQYLRSNGSKAEFGFNYDIIFEIGPEKVQFPAHLVQLSTVTSFFRDKYKIVRGSLSSSHPKPHKMQFEKLEPIGFEKMLNLLYTGEMEPFDVKTTHAILEAAKAIEFSLLEKMCFNSFKTNICVDNVAEYYHLAVLRDDDALKEIAVEIIKEKTWDVFLADTFVRLQEDVLVTLLKSDDYYLEEKRIFDAVKKWALAKLEVQQTKEETPSSSDSASRKAHGSVLREVMGEAFKYIRFPLMTSDEFRRVARENNGDIADENLKFLKATEVADILMFILGKQSPDTDLGEPAPPAGFICTPRPLQLKTKIKIEEGCPYSECQRNKRFEAGPVELFAPKYVSTVLKEEDEDDVDSVMDVETPNVTSPETDEVEVLDGDFDETPAEGPKPKKIKLSDNPSRITAPPKPPRSSILTLSAFVKQLHFSDNASETQVINESVKLSPNNMRLYLPCLKDFNIRIVPKRATTATGQTGSSFKSGLRTRFSQRRLEDILFFRTSDPEQNGAEGALETLFSQRVNINITYDTSPVCPPEISASGELTDVTILKVNHDEGILVLHQLPDAQKIINGAGSFPLKVLAISDCEVTNLEPFRTDLLEVIVIRKVKGLPNRTNFLSSCSNLREVCWNAHGAEKEREKDVLDFTECLLRRNRSIKKISLSKCFLTLPLARMPGQNFVEELYLDNCDYNPNFIHGLSDHFPYLKRIQLYSKKIDDLVLINILKIRSIEWIFLWDFDYQHKKDQPKLPHSKNKKFSYVLTADSVIAEKFLTAILGDKLKAKTTGSGHTFVLEKKRFDNLPGTSSTPVSDWDPSDPGNWTGTSFMKNSKYETVSKLDYKHNSYDKFYPCYDLFEWSDTSKQTEKKKKQISGGLAGASGSDPVAGPSTT